jgi:hypothetical protein
MKKSIMAVMAVLALGSSVAFAEGGGDRTFERSEAHMKAAMASQSSQNTQLATSAQVEATKIDTQAQK